MHRVEQVYHQVKSAFLLLISRDCSKGYRESEQVILLFNQAWTCSEGAKVLYHFCWLQTHKPHIHRTEGEKRMRTGGKGKETETEGKCSSNFLKALPFKANHTGTYTHLP